ncbi:MAG: hypothetical protein QXJ28_01465, partial [Candidatus Pacearchaeota archaeon]
MLVNLSNFNDMEINKKEGKLHTKQNKRFSTNYNQLLFLFVFTIALILLVGYLFFYKLFLNVSFSPALKEDIEDEDVKAAFESIKNNFNNEIISKAEKNPTYSGDVDSNVQKRGLSVEKQVASSGYIIEFDLPSIGQKSLEISKRNIEDSRKKRALDDYKLSFDSEFNKIKGNIVKELLNSKVRKDNINYNNLQESMVEYKVLFSGMYLNITPKEAEIVKKVRGVKGVYPNIIYKANLPVSVPIIGAPRIWIRDANLNLCSLSRRACLTGEGVKIAIIDTGVDYNHPMLGRG